MKLCTFTNKNRPYCTCVQARTDSENSSKGLPNAQTSTGRAVTATIAKKVSGRGNAEAQRAYYVPTRPAEPHERTAERHKGTVE